MLSPFSCYDLFSKAKPRFCSAQRIQPTERTFLHVESLAFLAMAKNLKEANEVPNALAAGRQSVKHGTVGTIQPTLALLMGRLSAAVLS
jgi:hypothetical protein